MVHGFTQTSSCWSPFAELVGDRRELMLVDAPGHGSSGAATSDLWSGAAALGATGGVADYLGYSMGGRLVLHLALRRPDLVSRLVLISATAGIEDPAARAERQRSDELLADRIEQIGVAEFIDEWLAGPLFAGLTTRTAHRDARLANTADGLSASLRHAGTATMEPLWDRLYQLDMPVLVVAGELDAKFVDLAARMTEAIGPNAAMVTVPGAGHTAHLEAPEVTAGRVNAWLVDSA